MGSELVSCDDQGTICIWEAASDSNYKCVGTIEGGVPCCSLAVRKGFIVAARTDGCVRIYGLVSGAAGAVAICSVEAFAYDALQTCLLVCKVSQNCLNLLVLLSVMHILCT